MKAEDKFFHINIRDYWLQNSNDEMGEMELKRTISEFSCPKNPDVEHFLKHNAIDFTKKNQSVTYLVFSAENRELLGYFTLALKPLAVREDTISETTKKKLLRISELDEKSDAYTMSAYLIAQMGKNYTDGADKNITGEELIKLALVAIRDVQYAIGGVVTFLEAEHKEKLLSFYAENHFRQFDTRQSSSKMREQHELVQLMRLI